MDQSNREESGEENQREVVETNETDDKSAGSRVTQNEVESDGNIRIDTDVEATRTVDDASTQDATVPVPGLVDPMIVGLEGQRIRRNNRERQGNEQEQKRRLDQPRRRPRRTRQQTAEERRQEREAELARERTERVQRAREAVMIANEAERIRS
jgi:hypothetical protein